MFKTIIIDTVDIASVLCEKYICSQLGIENIGDGGWSTNGWAKVKREWETMFRTIAMEGYAVIFISHSKDKTFKPKNAPEYNQIVPSCSTAYNEIIKNMSDIVGYIEVEGAQRRLVLRSVDGGIDCKCRFKHIAPIINFSYQSLVDALNEAIDKEAAETNNKFVTNERVVAPTVASYDYDKLMAEFSELAGTLMSKDQGNAPKITAVVDRYLGRGKKVSDATPDQAEFIHLIIGDIKAELM